LPSFSSSFAFSFSCRVHARNFLSFFAKVFMLHLLFEPDCPHVPLVFFLSFPRLILCALPSDFVFDSVVSSHQSLVLGPSVYPPETGPFGFPSLTRFLLQWPLTGRTSSPFKSLLSVYGRLPVFTFFYRPHCPFQGVLQGWFLFCSPFHWGFPIIMQTTRRLGFATVYK